MIIINGKELTELHYVGFDNVEHNIEEKWYVDENRVPHLVWQSVRSCFGAGYWRDDKPWLDTEAWNNG